MIAINNAYATGENKEIVETLFKTMYAPLGIEPKVSFYPSKRGLQMANQGAVDAEAGRVPLVAKRYADLLMVPTPMIEHQVAYFCLTEKKCQKDTQLRYAMITGFQAGNEYCQKHGLTCLYDQSQTFLSNALTNQAVDALIGGKVSSLSLLCRKGLKKVYYRLATDIEIVSYHLINKRHADLIEPLSSSIEAMHGSGAFDRFVAQGSSLPKKCDIQLIPIH